MVALERIVAGEPVVEIGDPRDLAGYRSGTPTIEAMVDRGGARTGLWVALRKEAELLGFIWVYQQEIRPFNDRQIALLQNFANQAVIAIENARLINETREALEQQTATAEVLQVINSSPGDLAPVFDAMLERATRLWAAKYGLLSTYDGDRFHGVAAVGFPVEIAEGLSRLGHPPPATVLGRLERTKETVQMADISAEPSYAEVFAVNPMLRGVRTSLSVPMLKEGALIGAFNVFRQEVRPFSDEQIALLQNFAEQAVIAMENARLITETREALEQQTATAEVLQVINSSPGDLAPVFDVILEKAHSLCNADHGSMFLRDGESFRAVGSHGLTEAFASRMQQGTANDSPLGQPLIAGEPFVHINDSALIQHPNYRDLDVVSSHRTLLSVPLRKGDALLGMIVAGRFEVKPFTDKQIALLQNFAAQAVIAMENARLLTETREALEQ
jgi:GAF domain-containing protein